MGGLPVVALLLFSCLTLSHCLIDFGDLPRFSHDEFSARVQADNIFVMFYAPWCGHCKKLMPVWTKLAQIHSSLDLATVDCTVETSLCSEENIRGYPTLILYSPFGGQEAQQGIRFVGSRTLSSLTSFIAEHISKDAAGEVGEFEKEDSVYVATTANYVKMFQRGEVFAMFYAPWCKHCKALKPVWDTLAAAINQDEQQDRPIIAKVDCTQHSAVCNEYDVNGYPTLLYMKEGTVAATYQGERDFDSLLAFIEQQHGTVKETEDEESGKVLRQNPEQEPDAVLTIQGADFQNLISSTSTFVFIKYYAPWCGHCKKLAPVWEQLAKKHANVNGIVLAKLDCTDYSHICTAQQISGYPTLKLYRNSKVVDTYSGERTVESMSRFINKHLSKDEL